MKTDIETRLRRAIREYVDAVPVPDTAFPVRPTSRPVSLRWLVPVAAGLAVLVAVGVGLLVPRAGEPPDAADAALSLPAVIDQPKGRVPALPADRAVGPGVAVYWSCFEDISLGCPPYLVTADGTHYRLPASPIGGGTNRGEVTLSPDGRWLGQMREGEYLLRDLTGTEVRRYPDRGYLTTLAWSSDGRWLVVGRYGPVRKGLPLWRIDLSTGAAVKIPLPFAGKARILSAHVVDVARSGAVLLVKDPTPMSVDCLENALCDPPNRKLVLVDPVSGVRRWTRTINLSDMLQIAEYARVVRLTPDEAGVLIAVNRKHRDNMGAPTSYSGDLLEVRLDGKRVWRYDIKDGTPDTVETPPPGSNKAGKVQPGVERTVLSFEHNGVLVLTDSQQGSRLDLLDPATGEETAVTRAPSLHLLTVRGGI